MTHCATVREFATNDDLFDCLMGSQHVTPSAVSTIPLSPKTHVSIERVAPDAPVTAESLPSPKTPVSVKVVASAPDAPRKDGRQLDKYDRALLHYQNIKRKMQAYCDEHEIDPGIRAKLVECLLGEDDGGLSIFNFKYILDELADWIDANPILRRANLSHLAWIHDKTKSAYSVLYPHLM